MTIPATERKAGPLAGDGANTSFPFTFKVFAASDILVTFADSAGAETEMVLDSDYSVVLNGDQDSNPGGTVTYPVSGTPLAANETLTITGNLELSQEAALPGGGDFNPGVVNDALDRIVMLVQQLKEEISRSVKVGVSSTTTPDQLMTDLNAAVSDAVAAAAAAAADAGTAQAAATSAGIDALAAEAAADSIGAVNGLVKGNGAGMVSAAVAGTDYVAPGVNQTFSKAQRGAVVALTDGATITPNFNDGNNFSVTLGGNRSLENPTNLTAGQGGAISITQDGTGNRTLSFGSYWKFANGVAPVLTGTAGAVDLLVYQVESSTRIAAALTRNIK